MPVVNHAPLPGTDLWCGDTAGRVLRAGRGQRADHIRTLHPDGAELVIGGGTCSRGAGDRLERDRRRPLAVLQPGRGRRLVLDLGLGYTYTRGGDRVINVFSPGRRSPTKTTRTSASSPGRTRSTRSASAACTARRSTSPSAGTGGSTARATCRPRADWNSRLGFDVGGRWGTAHVDLIPVADPTNYLRRHGISHGIYVGANWDWERPMGAWILFGGLRAEWGHNWMNLVPPQDGNIQDVNILLTLGVRF